MNEPPTEFESATPFQRIVAQCIDTFFIIVVVAIPASFASPNSTLGMLIGLFSLVIGLAYRLIGDGLFGGAALGKRLFGIYVVDAATRKPCSIGQAALRMGILVIPFAYMIEPVVLFCDGQQRWGDQLAKTYVLRRKPKPVPEVSRPLRPIDFTHLRDTLDTKHPDE